MRVPIRVATRREIAGVLDVWRAAEAVESVTDDTASLERLMRRDPEALLIVELRGRLVGTLIVGWDGWRGALCRLAVLPEARRRGVATALVHEGERRLTALGARRIAAIVVDEHHHAVAFWRALGFEHDLRVGRWVKTVE